MRKRRLTAEEWQAEAQRALCRSRMRTLGSVAFLKPAEKPQPEGDRLLTLAEAADRLSVSKDTARRMAKTGRLTARKVGRSLRVTAESVRAVIAGKR